MLDRLWAPWRMQYVTNAQTTPGCVFCEALQRGDDRAARILYRARWNFVIMNIYPYNTGHLMIVPFEHVPSPVQAQKAQTDEMMDLVRVCQSAMVAAFKPEGFNIGMNLGKCAGAGVLDHYHMHVVPRWSGDTNYMTVTGETRVLAQDLDDTYRLLANHFNQADIQKSEPGR